MKTIENIIQNDYASRDYILNDYQISLLVYSEQMMEIKTKRGKFDGMTYDYRQKLIFNY
ncbi:MAG: hypothetical protein ACLRQF_04935 [Thomasclavelia ramosa]